MSGKVSENVTNNVPFMLCALDVSYMINDMFFVYLSFHLHLEFEEGIETGAQIFTAGVQYRFGTGSISRY